MAVEMRNKIIKLPSLDAITRSVEEIREEMEVLSTLQTGALLSHPLARTVYAEFLAYLDKGKIRSAEQISPGVWSTNSWVKQGILTGFRLGGIVEMSGDDKTLRFFDKDTLPLKQFIPGDGVRVVPGGSSIRAGSYVGRGVIIMPPAYINIGAYVDEGTMIDSLALVGSCAQVGRKCHISAGAKIGGVLEPINAKPCIVGDGVVMGVNSSISEGVMLMDRVVLGAGVQITASTPVIDLVNGHYYTSKDSPLVVPSGAVVVPGVRPLKSQSEFARQALLGLVTPVIVKYRDARTDAKTALEEALRS